MQDTCAQSLGQEDPLQKEIATSSVDKNLPAMQEPLVQFLGREDPLKKGSATHSNILGLPLWLSW